MKNLTQVFSQESLTLLRNLLSESVVSAREPRQPRQRRQSRSQRGFTPRKRERRQLREDVSSPTLDAVGDFYGEHYDLASSEGRERFQAYLEEHPAQVIGDIVAICKPDCWWCWCDFGRARHRY